MLGFGSPKKRITEMEMDEIRKSLHQLDERERRDLAMIFNSSLNDKSERIKGISREEYDLGIGWLKDNKSKHSLEDNDIEKVEKYFEEHLKD
jgi:hypothetical protein